jgi:hypothetical protein
MFEDQEEVGFPPSTDPRDEAALQLMELPDGGAAFADALHQDTKDHWRLVLSHGGKTFVLHDSGPDAVTRLAQRYIAWLKDPLAEQRREQAIAEEKRKREAAQAAVDRAVQKRRQLFTKSILGGGQ